MSFSKVISVSWDGTLVEKFQVESLRNGWLSNPIQQSILEHEIGGMRMPDRKDPNKDKKMGMGNREQPGPGQRTPGRDFEEDDLSTGSRQGGHHSYNQGKQGGAGSFDREDREREQPGSKQKDQKK